MKGFIKKYFPESIIRANLILTAFIVILLTLYLIIQLVSFLQSSSILEKSIRIVNNQNTIETLYGNLLESEISLHFYLRGNLPSDITIFSKLKKNKEILENFNAAEREHFGIQFINKLNTFNDILLENNRLYLKTEQNHLEAYETLKKINETYFVTKEFMNTIKDNLIEETEINMITLNQSMNFNSVLLLILVLIIFSLVFMSFKFRKSLIDKLQFLKDKFQFFTDERSYRSIQYTVNDEVKPVIEAYNKLSEKIHSQHAIIEKLNSYLSNIVESMPSAIIATDDKGIITHLNKSAEEQISTDTNETIGKSIWDVAKFFLKYQDYFSSVINTKKPVELHNEELISSRFHNISIYPLAFEDIPGAVISFDDVTELVKIDEQLRQSQKMETIGILAGGLAHDFNNVLGGIFGTVSLIKFKIEKHKDIELEQLQKYLHTIEESSYRAADLVGRLLTLSRKKDLKFAPIDLNTSLENVLKICRNTFDKSIEIKHEYYKERAVISADPAQIEQVLLNLCINASHALTLMRGKDEHKGGEINISIDKIDADKHFRTIHPEAQQIDYWVLSIRDNGVGMNQETIEKIFDPFFTTKAKEQGTGLGLAMTYNIIKQHSGFIDVYSQDGTGSSFNIFLPVLHTKDLIIETSNKENIHPGEGLILVIDDEEIMRNITSGMLIESGYTVITATHGDEGVDIYKEKNDEIAAVIIDVVMPRKSGDETYNELKEINKDIKVLVMSGFSQDERVQQMLAKGAKQFIQKPFNMEKLTKAIESVIKSQD